MTKDLKRQLKKLEERLNVNQKRRRIAKVVYDLKIYPCSLNLSSFDADVILCLPDNCHRSLNDVMPSQGYMIKYSPLK